MTTYADPTRCPDCRASLPEAPQICRRCALPLTGPDAVELFTTLQHADRLLAVLRQQASTGAASGSRSPSVPRTAPGSLLGDVTPYPASGPDSCPPRPPVAPAHGGTRLTGASVPRILLTLGALCLLVAAVTFLAVAWSWLGVGGRTAVLLVLTAGALGGADVFARRGLRMAAEALTVVGLGLVALDVVGARHAGWLGDVTDAGLVTTVGSVVATVALLMLLVTLPRPLVSPGLVARRSPSWSPASAPRCPWTPRSRCSSPPSSCWGSAASVRRSAARRCGWRPCPPPRSAGCTCWSPASAAP